jgi:acetyl-CoA C-acetyltransferase
MSVDVAIIGIGLHPFGRHDASGAEQGALAVRAALADAGLQWRDVQAAFGGSLDGGAADSLLKHLGLTEIPFTNVANGCATGGSALSAAAAAVRAGQADIALAVGFDKHSRGSFNPPPSKYGLPDWYGSTGMMVTTQFFALKTQRYLHQYGLPSTLLAKIAERALRNGALNPLAWRRKPFTAREIETSAPVNPPLTQYMFCSPSEGAAAVIVANAATARRFTRSPVWIKSLAFRTRRHGSFEVFSPALAPQASPAPTVTASKAAYEEAGVGPKDVQVVQIQDTDAGSELIHMAETGFCQHGEQAELIESGATEIGGRLPVNTDGGCIANGEPVGASGLRQVHEVCLQLRGRAGARQVPGQPRLGFTHVYGVPGISAVAILAR